MHVCVLAVWTGWLLRLACDTHLREEFETLHQAVLELVRVGYDIWIVKQYSRFCTVLKFFTDHLWGFGDCGTLAL